MMTPLESHLLRAYLDGELGAEAAADFEVLMLQRADIAELVEADTALQLALAGTKTQCPDIALQSSPEPPHVRVAPVEQDRDTQSNTSSQANKVAQMRRLDIEPSWRRFATKFAAAAAVFFAVGLGVGTLRRAPMPLAGGAVTAYVDKVRGDAKVPEIKMRSGDYLVMVVPVVSPNACEATIRVLQRDVLIVQAPATADEFGYASVVIPRANLSAGDARVLVDCGARTVGEYPILISP